MNERRNELKLYTEKSTINNKILNFKIKKNGNDKIIETVFLKNNKTVILIKNNGTIIYNQDNVIINILNKVIDEENVSQKDKELIKIIIDNYQNKSKKEKIKDFIKELSYSTLSAILIKIIFG